MDEAFGKEVLKAATSKAKQKDEAVVARFKAKGKDGLAKTLSHDYRDVLTRAKRRMQYYKKRYSHASYEVEAEFSNVIEEYDLFNILSIQRCS